MSDSAPFDLVAGRYRLEIRVGSGRFGEVWRATDTLLGRPVAVKLMRPELARQQLAHRRFQAEARYAGSIAHEAIAKIYDYEAGTPSQRPFLVMEYVAGSSLAEELSAGQLGPARAMDLVAQIAAGLEAAQTVGLAHGDIKPNNVLLGGDGRVKLTDFGVAFAAGATEDTMPETLLGTPEYQAPERITGGNATAASDLYSLGIVAFQCLTGRVPFRGRAVDVAHAHRSWPLPPLPAGTPPQVERLIAELTAKDPALRPVSAGDVARRAAGLRDELALDPSAAGQRSGPITDLASQPPDDPPGGPASLAATPAPARRRPYPRRLAVLGAGVVIVVAAACAGLFMAAHHGEQSGGGAPAARLVRVDEAALTGQPVATVAARLRGQGLIVTIQWLPSSRMRAGLVISVRPSGWLHPGSRVLVTGAASPGATASPKRGRTKPPARRTPSAPARPSRHGGPPTVPSSNTPSPIPTLTGSPSPSVSPAPTPTSAGPSPSGSVGVGARPAPAWSAGSCAIPAAQWVTVSLAAGPLPAAQCPGLTPLRS